MRAVRDALIRHAQGQVVSPSPGQLLFSDPPGDCHIKYGRFIDGPYFVIKIATGFYMNPSKGLSTNNGMVLVFDAQTGETKAILQDEGWLTSWRTAAAGALAAVAGAPAQISGLGVIGTGHQAELQALWSAAALGIESVTVWGRKPELAARLADRLRSVGQKASAVSTVKEVFDRCNVVVSCTPSAEAIIPSSVVRAGTHLVAIGADSPGKQELDPLIFRRARVVMVDDLRQCADHGDLSYALRESMIATDDVVLLGSVLAGLVPGRHTEEDITLVDLTGVAAQDIAIATLAVDMPFSER